MKKRFLSILLTLTMLLSLFPGMAVTVSASDGKIQSISSWMSREGNTVTITPASGASYILEVWNARTHGDEQGYGANGQYLIVKPTNAMVGRDIVTDPDELYPYADGGVRNPKNAHLTNQPPLTTSTTVTISEECVIVIMQVDPNVKVEGYSSDGDCYAVLGAYAEEVGVELQSISLTADTSLLATINANDVVGKIIDKMIVENGVIVSSHPDFSSRGMLGIKVTPDNAADLINPYLIEETLTSLGVSSLDGQALIDAVSNRFNVPVDWADLEIINPEYVVAESDVYGLMVYGGVSYASQHASLHPDIAVTFNGTAIDADELTLMKDWENNIVYETLLFGVSLGPVGAPTEVPDEPVTPPAGETKAIVNLGADSFSVDENGKVTFNLPEEDGYFYCPIVMPAAAMEGSGITAQKYVEYLMEGTKHNVIDVTDPAAFDIGDMEAAAALAHSGTGQIYITNAALDGDDFDWVLYSDSIVGVLKLSADNMVSGAYGADYFPGTGSENVYVYGIYGVYAALVEFEGEAGGDDVTDGFVAELGTDWISRSDNTVTINVPNGEKYMLGIVKHADDEDAEYYREYFNDFVGEQIITPENWEYVDNDCSVGIYDGEIDGEYYGYVGIEELSTSDGTPIVLNITEDQSIFLFHVSATPFLQDMTGYKMYAILGVHAGSYTCGSDVPTPPVEPDEPKTESNVNSDSFEEGELTVEGLIDEAKEWLDKIEGANPTDDIKVSVNMNVEVKASDVVNATEKDAIEDIASAQSSNLEYLDITIEKTVLINDVKSDADSGPIYATHDLIEIEIAFPTAGKSNFKVYRYHNGDVQVLTEIPGADGECIVVGDGKITIKAKFFSTYAVGYEDNNGPVHVNYTDSNLTDFYWDGTTNLTIADEAVITITKPYTQKANLTISADATILGNGKTITSRIGNNLYETIIVNNGANVLMKDVSIERVTTGYIKKNLILIDGAALTCENISVNVEVMGVFELLNNGSLIVRGDDTTITSESNVDNGRPIFDNKAGTVTIMAGEYTRSGNSGQIVGNGATATVNIQGGTFKNPEGNTDTIANGIINMTGGTIISTKAAAIRSGKTGDKVTITGGTIKNSAKAVRLGRDTDASAGTVVIGGNVSFEGNTVDVYLTLKNSVSNVVTIRDDFTGRVSVKSSKTLATNEKLPITTDGTAKKLRSQVYSADANLAVSFEDTGYLYLWKHVHDYTQDVVDDEYLVSPATCDALAVYLKSCECGNGSDDASKVFASGSLRTHDYGFKSNGMEHWDECRYDDCKDVINKADHTYTEFHCEGDYHWYECSHAACTANNGKVAHTYTEFHSDADDHWYECSHAECVVNNGKVDHTYTEFHSDADDHWYECSHAECVVNNGKVAHTYTEFHSDADYHWYECSHADCVVNNGKAAHTYTEFRSDADYHWYECSHADCTVNNGKIEHTFDQFESNGVHHWYECSDADCTKISDETDHDFVRVTDADYHWYECSDPACKFIKDKEAHTFTEFHSEGDSHWYECSHADCAVNNGKVAHTYTEFRSDADYHWYECSHAACTANNGKVPHTYTEFHSDADDHWYECSHAECVVNNGKVDHTFTEFHSNDGYHWYECSHDACAVKSGEAAHSFTQFESNGVHHWYECSHFACTKISDETRHDFVRMTDNNYHWYQCSDPACKFIKDKEAHTSSDWIVDVYEQVGVNGRMHKECTVCEHVLTTVVVPALSPEKKDDHDDVVVKPDFTNCPKDATCPVWSFKDAVAFEWYHDGVHYCIENGLMNGLPENLFDPAGATTRAQIVTILWRMEGQPLVAVAEGFNDVSDSDWYNNAVRWASSSGIAEGYGEGIFAPNDAVTREQMVTILWRYAMYKSFDVSVGVETNILSYGDAFDIAHYAIPAMQWACGSGLMRGIADENGGMILDPQGTTTRAQTATMLMRFCVEIEK